MESHSKSILNPVTKTAGTETDLRLGLWSLDSVTRHLNIDGGFRQLLGQPAPACENLSQLIGLIHPQDAPEFESRIMAALQGRSVDFAMEYRLRHSEWGWLWMFARATTSPSNHALVLRGYTLDINDRKFVDYALRKALEQSESMLRSAPTAIVVLHGNVITSGNQAFEQMFASPLHTLVGLDMRTLVLDTNQWSRALEGMADVRSAAPPAEGNIQFRRPDQSEFTARLSGRRLDTKGDAVVCLADITRQVAMSRALEQARDSAQAASLAKSRFLATMSHEIRTPMNGVIGMLELLGATPLDANQQQTLQVARDSAVALLTILNEILDYSKIEAGQMDIKCEPVNVGELLLQSTELYRELARRKGLSLDLASEPGLPPIVLTDRLRLSQIINNLLSNAVKFTSRGTISVVIGRREPPSGNPQLHIEIRDTGVGISSADLDKLFQPFVQLDSGSTRRHGGSGLGLVISRKLVECMGGAMSIRSTPDKGTVVEVDLPLKLPADTHNNSEARPMVSISAPSVAQRPAKILLVEDHPVNQMLLKRQLEMLGHTVKVANDGKEGLQLFIQNPFDLILCDCHMPNMDGYEMARAVRAMEQQTGSSHHMPIIACTASTMQEDIERCLDAGMNAVLAKPVQLGDLRGKLDPWLTRSGGALQSASS